MSPLLTKVARACLLMKGGTNCVLSLIVFHVKLSFLVVHFNVLTLFVGVHVTSNPKKLL